MASDALRKLVISKLVHCEMTIAVHKRDEKIKVTDT